jgi:hypothetical protein
MSRAETQDFLTLQSLGSVLACTLNGTKEMKTHKIFTVTTPPKNTLRAWPWIDFKNIVFQNGFLTSTCLSIIGTLADDSNKITANIWVSPERQSLCYNA